MTQIQKKKKNGRPVLEKKTLQKTFFTSVLIIIREMAKNHREKYWEDVAVNLSENILSATETMTQKSSIYLLGMSNHIFNFTFKTSQYPFVAYLCCMYILKFFEKKKTKKHDFARLIFAFKKFQEMRTKSLFLSFQNSFSTSYFPLSREPLDQSSSLTPLWKNNWKL